MEELKCRTAARLANGWEEASPPRLFDVKIGPEVVEPRYSQTFKFRVVSKPPPRGPLIVVLFSPADAQALHGRLRRLKEAWLHEMQCATPAEQR